MSIQWNNIKQNRPAIFDWTVFLFSMSLGFVFPSLGGFVNSPAFSCWMLVALLLYTAGIWLKHRPLYYRLAKAGNPNPSVPFLLFLLIGHWIIFLFVFILAEEAFRQAIGLQQIPGGATSGYSIAASIFGAVFITWLAFRPGGKSRKALSETYVFRRELAADLLLISGVAMLSFVFWEKSLLEMMARMPINGVGDVMILFVFLAVSYVLFYLPLRYLFLIEDHFSKTAWKRLLLIFILIMLRGLFTAAHL
jgi:hypothetical protein